MYKEEKTKKKRKKKVSKIFITLLFFVVISICVYALKNFVIQSIGNISKSSTESNDIRIKKNSDANDEYGYAINHKSDVGIGDLILVNNNLSYMFPKENKIVSVWNNKNNSYKVYDNEIALNEEVIPYLNNMMSDFEIAESIHNVTVISGYRSLKDQKRIVKEKTQQLGKVKAEMLATKPGYSEHHTGYAMDIGILKDNGQWVTYTGTGDYGWINENCGNYGFIHRYSGDKSDITGITNESWHYRYVGKPHANIIKDNNFCLEEYIDYLKNYHFGSKHLNYTDFDGTKYEIYYVKVANGETKIPVPKDKKYSISGNNIDGFIVTVIKEK